MDASEALGQRLEARGQRLVKALGRSTIELSLRTVKVSVQQGRTVMYFRADYFRSGFWAAGLWGRARGGLTVNFDMAVIDPGKLAALRAIRRPHVFELVGVNWPSPDGLV